MSIEKDYWNEGRERLQVLEQNSSNPLTQQIIEKGLVELALKESLFENTQISQDLSVVSPIKRVGMFVFVHQIARDDWSYTDGTFQMNKGDEYLNVHIPPAEPGSVTLSDATRNYTAMAEYVRDFLPDLKYVIGITYERLARTGKRQHYSSFSIEIPEELKSPMEEMYKRYTPQGQRGDLPGPTVLSYHTRESFLREFGVI